MRAGKELERSEPAPPRAEVHDFLAGGGEMGANIRAHDWASTPLGDPSSWPQSLRFALSICLSTPLVSAVHWGPELRILYNDAYAPALANKHPWGLGQPFAAVWAEIWDVLGPQIDAVIATGIGFSTENQFLRMERRGGAEDTWWIYSFAPIRGENGTVAGILVTALETTEKVRAERAAFAERDRGRSVLDGMGEGFALLDHDFRILDVNAEAMRLETRPRGAIIGRTHWEAYPGTETSDLGRLYRQAMTERVPVSLEHCYAWEDGRESWIEMRAYPVTQGLAIFFRDISERRAADDTLRSSEARLSVSEESLRLSTEAAEVGTWDLDLTTNVLTWSDRTKAMFGISPDVPCSMADFYAGLHPDDREATSAAFAAAVDPVVRAIYDVEYRTVGKEDGVVRWVAAKGKGLFDATGRCVRAIGTAIDITARKRIEARRLALVEISDAIRDLTDPAALAFAAAEALGKTLGVSRAGYGTINKAAETITIERDWNAAGIRSLAGTLHFRDYGSYIEDLKRGRTVAIADAAADPRTAATTDALAAISARSFVNMPVTEAGAFVALLYLNHATPREWPKDELAFISEVADRTRTATARLTAEAELRAAEAKFEAIVNSIDQMIWSTRPDGFHDYYNQRWYDYTGMPEGSTDGEAWTGMFHPDDQERARGLWRHSLATGEAYHIEYRLRHRSGQYRWVLGRAQAVRDASGRITRWYGTCTDIQDMVEARQVVARSRQDLERLVEARTAERNRLWSLTNLLVAVIAFDSTIREVNPAWPALLGWTEAELAGRSYAGFVHPDDAQRSLAWMASQANGVKGVELENRYLCKDGGYRWIAWTITAGEGVFHCIGRDVTEQKEQAAALALAEEAMRQAQKMEAVGQLTGGIAHDFNNMLAVVIGSLDLLGRRLESADSRIRRYVEAATDGARRAALLTQRLLAFSRQQPLKPEPIDPNKLVASMSELIRRSIGSDIRLETVLASGLWRTQADPHQLENVLLNLAVNARDAMPEGGRLTIETQNAHLDARYAAAHLGVHAGQYVMIAVTDTGSGMPEDVIAKAFDPFFTTKPVGKGTGLGLSQVYGFVKQSGGHVKIYSEPGEGTTVKIYLPRLSGAEMALAQNESISDMPNGDSQEVVLVVEDEPAVRQFSVDALTELGYRVLEADGAAAALRLLDQHTEIALMFTDIVMPDLNGAKLADEALRRRPDLKVLYTTGYTRNAVVHNGILDQGVELIGKPFTVQELATKVREMLDSPATEAGGATTRSRQ